MKQTIGGLLFLALCAAITVQADHLGWMLPYKSADRSSCCQDADCRVAVVAVLAWQDTQALVFVDGKTFLLPQASVHLSASGEGYWCARGAIDQTPSPFTTRCIFFVVGH